MNERRLEITVGVFVLIGAACLIYLSLVLGSVGGLGWGAYSIYAEFDSVEGLTSGASVEIAGVPVGRVGDIELVGETARVEIQLKKSVQIDVDTVCSVRTKGIIGEKFLRLEPGGADEMIKPGGRIIETQSPLDLQDLVSQFIHGNAGGKKNDEDED